MNPDYRFPDCLCPGPDFKTVRTFTRPPEGETRFDYQGQDYFRELRLCRKCGHIVSIHDLDLGPLYQGNYVDATYGPEGLKRTFHRVMNLPPERSDNTARVTRVAQTCLEQFSGGKKESVRVLDVGSGLCVFLAKLLDQGFAGLALDPDPRAAVHARETAGVPSVNADFLTVQGLGSFDLIAFNKVLEHVLDPVSFLARSHGFLREEGLVYLELPDGESAAEEGYDREEFFIEHHHAFSAASTVFLALKAGFMVRNLQRLIEPSGKHTIWAFLKKRPNLP